MQTSRMILNRNPAYNHRQSQAAGSEVHRSAHVAVLRLNNALHQLTRHDTCLNAPDWGKKAIDAWGIVRDESPPHAKSVAALNAISAQVDQLMIDTLDSLHIPAITLRTTVRSGSAAIPIEQWAYYTSWPPELHHRQPLVWISDLLAAEPVQVVVVVGPTALTANPQSMIRVAAHVAKSAGVFVSIPVTADAPAEVIPAREVEEALRVYSDMIGTILVNAPEHDWPDVPSMQRAEIEGALAAHKVISVSQPLTVGGQFAKRIMTAYLTRKMERHLARLKIGATYGVDGTSDVRRWPEQLRALSEMIRLPDDRQDTDDMDIAERRQGAEDDVGGAPEEGGGHARLTGPGRQLRAALAVGATASYVFDPSRQRCSACEVFKRGVRCRRWGVYTCDACEMTPTRNDRHGASGHEPVPGNDRPPEFRLWPAAPANAG